MLYLLVGFFGGFTPPKEIKDGNITYKDDVDIANSLNSGFWEKVKGIMKRVKIDPKKAM